MRYWLSLLLSCTLFCATTQQASAGFIGNDQLLASDQTDLQRTQILEALDQGRDHLLRMGVDPQFVRDRVSHMTPAELTQFQAHLDELTYGQDILGVILLLFIIFIITDMLGATNIFPFVKCINC